MAYWATKSRKKWGAAHREGYKILRKKSKFLTIKWQIHEKSGALVLYCQPLILRSLTHHTMRIDYFNNLLDCVLHIANPIWLARWCNQRYPCVCPMCCRSWYTRANTSFKSMFVFFWTKLVHDNVTQLEKWVKIR